MKPQPLINCILIASLALLTGCATRSISNSGYYEPSPGLFARPTPSNAAFQYRGELSEFDVLGIGRGEPASDNEIERALTAAQSLKLQRNSSILLIQSGAMFPDAPMVEELNRHFRVVPFSGVPPHQSKTSHGSAEDRDPESFSESLRLAAARGGTDAILCYWGILESGSENLATKTISWVPVVNWIVPDVRQHMRIRLKLALIDVRTGSWTVMTPQSFEDARITRSPRRGVVDQQQIEALKTKAYHAAIESLIKGYSEVSLR